MSVRIKICGITRRRDAEAAVEMGVDFLGFNFYPRSPRFIDPALVRAILTDLPRAVHTVGVFVNENADHITAMMDAAGLGMAQLHGDETPELCASLPFPVLKALRVATAADLEPAPAYMTWALLVDSKTPVFGGSGERPDWELAARAKKFSNRLVLSGGLIPENVAEAVAAVRPWAVDVASGVESAPGIKDEEKMRRFIEAVKNVSG